MATAFMYGNALKRALNKEIDWDTDTIKVALLNGYSKNQDTHQDWADVSADEASGTGYTAGGATLGSKTITYDAATNKVRLGGANVSWSNSTITATHAIIYDSTSGVLMGCVDFGGSQSSSNGTFAVNWNGGIIFEITAGAEA